MKGMFALVSLLLLLHGCSRQDGAGQETKNKGDILAAQVKAAILEDDDICEAVFRYQFEHNVSVAQQNAKAYFLEIYRNDPSNEFIARFIGNSPLVKKGSEFSLGKGVKFRIDSIKRIDKNMAEVEGGYYEGGKSADANIYTVIREKNGWVVEKVEGLWIS
jgi:hypothetical protein